MVQKLNIVFEDSNIIALNKPSGLLIIPDRFDPEKPNAYTILKSLYPEVWIVHRIDKETSGLLLFAKNEVAHRDLNILFESHTIDKNYICFTESAPLEEEGIIDAPIAHSPAHTSKMMIHPKGKSSQTKFKLLERYHGHSCVLAKPLSGRTHQIRIHFAYMGCPLICDPLYGIRTEISIADIKKRPGLSKDQEIRPLLQRTALHSWKLNFILNAVSYELEAELPKDLKALQNQLRKWTKN
ncbi:MAG: RNA pseudouridine synthase [Saprospiraceae bacterium]|nr:RNA pseudouridine synthase [Saprospiraceae bacterium]